MLDTISVANIKTVLHSLISLFRWPQRQFFSFSKFNEVFGCSAPFSCDSSRYLFSLLLLAFCSIVVNVSSMIRSASGKAIIVKDPISSFWWNLDRYHAISRFISLLATSFICIAISIVLSDAIKALLSSQVQLHWANFYTFEVSISWNSDTQVEVALEIASDQTSQTSGTSDQTVPDRSDLWSDENALEDHCVLEVRSKPPLIRRVPDQSDPWSDKFQSIVQTSSRPLSRLKCVRNSLIREWF